MRSRKGKPPSLPEPDPNLKQTSSSRKRQGGRRRSRPYQELQPQIIVAVIGIIGTIIISLVPIITALITGTQTPSAHVTVTAISTPTLTPTFTGTPSTPTPFRYPLEEIFPQVADGRDFSFSNEGGVLNRQFVGDQNCIHSGVYGLRLIYDMKGGGNGGWGVYWSFFPDQGYFDASEFQALTFWVKGIVGRETFQIEMRDTDGHSFWMESISVLVVPSDWVMVSIPFNKFQGVNVSSLENFIFGVNSTHGSGSICIDDIAFVR